jgi:hypothetical protein
MWSYCVIQIKLRCCTLALCETVLQAWMAQFQTLVNPVLIFRYIWGLHVVRVFKALGRSRVGSSHKCFAYTQSFNGLKWGASLRLLSIL